MILEYKRFFYLLEEFKEMTVDSDQIEGNTHLSVQYSDTKIPVKDFLSIVKDYSYNRDDSYEDRLDIVTTAYGIETFTPQDEEEDDNDDSVY